MAGVPQPAAATPLPRPHGRQSRQSRQPRSALSLVKVPLDGTRISKMVAALDCTQQAEPASSGLGLWPYRLAVPVRSPRTARKGRPSPLGELPPGISQGTGRSGGSPAITPQPIWCWHGCRLASVAVRLRHAHPPTLGFHPPQHPAESPPACPKGSAGMEDARSPRSASKPGKQGFGLALGGRAGVEERVGSE